MNKFPKNYQSWVEYSFVSRYKYSKTVICFNKHKVNNTLSNEVMKYFAASQLPMDSLIFEWWKKYQIINNKFVMEEEF